MCVNDGIRSQTSSAEFSFAIWQFGEEKEELDPEVKAKLDELLTAVWLTGQDEAFHQIFHLIMSENVSGQFCSCLSAPPFPSPSPSNFGPEMYFFLALVVVALSSLVKILGECSTFIPCLCFFSFLIPFFYARIRPQWLSKLRLLWLNVPWQVVCELISGHYAWTAA